MDSINMMNNQEMMWMMICMIVTTLFALIIGISIIIQTFLQVKILKELCKFNKENKFIS
jgi:hypothetical protein